MDPAELVRRLLADSALSRGWCLVLNSGNGALAYELARQSELRVVAVESDADPVEHSRRRLDAAGGYVRVSVHQLDPGGPLPYTDYVFNLIVDAAALSGEGSSVHRGEVHGCCGREEASHSWG